MIGLEVIDKEIEQLDSCRTISTQTISTSNTEERLEAAGAAIYHPGDEESTLAVDQPLACVETAAKPSLSVVTATDPVS